MNKRRKKAAIHEANCSYLFAGIRPNHRAFYQSTQHHIVAVVEFGENRFLAISGFEKKKKNLTKESVLCQLVLCTFLK